MGKRIKNALVLLEKIGVILFFSLHKVLGNRNIPLIVFVPITIFKNKMRTNCATVALITDVDYNFDKTKGN